MADEAELLENIRRVGVLLAELGHPPEQAVREAGRWSAVFSRDGLALQARLGAQQKFVEFSVFFRFDRAFAEFLAARVDDLQQVCYHYGCYHLIEVDQEEIRLSVHAKLYFSGLHYYALKEALEDLAAAAGELGHLLEPAIGPVGR